MSASLSSWLKSLAIAAPTALAIAGSVDLASAQNAPGDRPPTKEAPKDEPQAKDPRDEVRDTTKDARDTTKDARDTTKAARDTTRDARDDVRDARNDARDKVRDPRDPKDPARDQSRDARDPENLRPPTREDRPDARDDRRDARDNDVNGRASFRAEGTRAADIGLWFDRNTDKGLVVSDVASKGAIAKLGFQEGDRIVSVNGQRITRESDFITYLFADDVRNQKVKVVVVRDGNEEVILVEPAVFVDELSYVDHDPLENFGIIVDDRYTDKIVVWRVIPRSPAYYAGFRSGDVIVSLGHTRLANVAALVQRLTSVDPGEIQVQIGRGQNSRTLHVDVPKFVARSQRRTTLRPNFDAAERREDRLDRREDRIEDRRDDRIPAPRVPGAVVPPAVTPPAAVPAPAPAPAPKRPGSNDPAPRPGLFPRNR